MNYYLDQLISFIYIYNIIIINIYNKLFFCNNLSNSPLLILYYNLLESPKNYYPIHILGTEFKLVIFFTYSNTSSISLYLFTSYITVFILYYFNNNFALIQNGQ